VQGVELEPVPRDEVVVERREGARPQSFRERSLLVDDVVGKLHAFRAGHKSDLPHHLTKELACLRHGQQLVDRKARDGGQSRERTQIGELVPEDDANVVGEVSVDLSLPKFGH
jgi:hypothetical protein